MSELQLGIVEAKFADLIWEREPVTSSELVHLCADRFQWKRTTTHTVLKRLCDKGLFENNGGTVTAKLSREEFYTRHSRQYVASTFGGSLPAFLAAFTGGGQLTQEEREQLQALLNADGVGQS
jgi:predicted transcriptional regulator